MDRIDPRIPLSIGMSIALAAWLFWDLLLLLLFVPLGLAAWRKNRPRSE